jgi:hypothetical protein
VKQYIITSPRGVTETVEAETASVGDGQVLWLMDEGDTVVACYRDWWKFAVFESRHDPFMVVIGHDASFIHIGPLSIARESPEGEILSGILEALDIDEPRG